MMRRPRLTAAAMLAVVFIVGGLAGMAIEEGFGLDWFDFLDEDEEVVDARLLSGMELTDAQAAEIENVLEEQEDRLESYWETRLPDLHRIMAESDSSVRAVLTPKQRAIFDERIEARGARVPDGPD